MEQKTSQPATVSPTVSYTDAVTFARKHVSTGRIVIEFDVPIGGWHAGTGRFWIMCSIRQLSGAREFREIQLDGDGCVLADRRVSQERYAEIQKKFETI